MPLELPGYPQAVDIHITFEEGAEQPRFHSTVREHSALPKGFALYYTNQCPFTAKYVPVLEEMGGNTLCRPS